MVLNINFLATELHIGHSYKWNNFHLVLLHGCRVLIRGTWSSIFQVTQEREPQGRECINWNEFLFKCLILLCLLLNSLMISFVFTKILDFPDLTLNLKWKVTITWIPYLSKLEYWITNQQFAVLFSAVHPVRQQSDKVLTCFRNPFNKENNNLRRQLLSETNTLLSSILS